MLSAAILLFSSSLLDVRPQPVIADVCIASKGPYRFLVDTGAESTYIDPKLAAGLNLKPAYRVEVVSQYTTRLAPALRLNSLRIADTILPESELVIESIPEAKRLDASIVGVLGLNAFAGLNYTLRPAAGKLEIAPPRPNGETLPLRRAEGRIAIPAVMGNETLNFVLDSGANHVVLFRTPRAMSRIAAVPSTLSTIDGARYAVPACWTAEMIFGDRLRVGTLPAAIVSRPGTAVDDLLPASVFKAVYIDQARAEVVLVR